MYQGAKNNDKYEDEGERPSETKKREGCDGAEEGRVKHSLEVRHLGA
jgi:hypothetical protein